MTTLKSRIEMPAIKMAPENEYFSENWEITGDSKNQRF